MSKPKPYYVPCRTCGEEMIGILHERLRQDCYSCGGTALRGWTVDGIGNVHEIGGEAA